MLLPFIRVVSLIGLAMLTMTALSKELGTLTQGFNFSSFQLPCQPQAHWSIAFVSMSCKEFAPSTGIAGALCKLSIMPTFIRSAGPSSGLV